MSDPLVEQLIRTFETLGERVRTAVADETSVRIEQLTHAIQADRRATAEAAARDAAAAAEEAVARRLSADFARRENDVREIARRDAFEEGRTEGFEAGRTQGFDAGRTEGFEAGRTEGFQAGRAEGLQQGRAEAAAALQEQQSKAASALAATEASHASALGAAHAAHAATFQEQTRRHGEAVERLARAIRRLNGAASLSQTLDALAEAAAGEAQRVALFLVRDERLRLWSQSGFAALESQSTFELPLGEVRAIAEAVSAAEPRRTDGMGPAFAGPGPVALLAVPLTLSGQVTAVLCADDASADDNAQLASTLEVLARYAARVLESLTALRLAQASGFTAMTPVASGMQA